VYEYYLLHMYLSYLTHPLSSLSLLVPTRPVPESMTESLRYYTSDIHKAAFVLPGIYIIIHVIISIVNNIIIIHVITIVHLVNIIIQYNLFDNVFTYYKFYYVILYDVCNIYRIVHIYNIY
jgi:hypothetical protein